MEPLRHRTAVSPGASPLPASPPASPPPPAASELLETIGGLLRELRGAAVAPVALDDDLERGLGIDSLARMELMLRLEQAFRVRLPEAAVQAAQTPRDLLRALAAAAPRQGMALERPAVFERAAPSCVKDVPREAGTLMEVFQWHAGRAPDRAQVELLGSDADAAPAQRMSHAALGQAASELAGGLQRSGLVPGERVALMLPTGLAFFEAFAGILRAGGVPVPLYPPFRADQIEDHLRRQARILDNAGATLLIGDAQTLPATRILRAGAAQLRAVLTVDRLRALGGPPSAVARGPQDTALLQYTSGSTGQPKGVVLSHANLLSNIRAMGQALQADADDVFVSWLPLYHDMGLIGAWLASLYHGIPLVLMSPQAFLARPSSWLRAIHAHGGTLSAAPNFAYEILARKVPDDELQGLDLRRWRAAMNGAEPVHASTLSHFARRFGACGLDPRALMPVYGLAECGVGLAFPPLGRGPRIDRIDRHALHAFGRAQPLPAMAATAKAPGGPKGEGQAQGEGGGNEAEGGEGGRGEGAAGMQVVSCGLPLPGHEIRAVDAHGAELPERSEGRIEFRGPSATSGYFRNPQATRALFRGDWLDTGDVGYFAEGELYLTSRIKDLIIRGGHNLHPYDLEEAVAGLPGIRKGGVAVFGAPDPASATDRIVVLAETGVQAPQPRAALRARIASLAVALLGVPADDIVLAGPRTVPKTSSGKIRRAACRRLYLEGRLGAGAPPVGWQLAHLWLGALGQRWRAPLQPLANAFFGAWAWTLFGVAALATTAVAAWPWRAARGRAGRAVARLLLRASGLPWRVQGEARLGGGRTVVVANHASYTDWLLLTAALPAGLGFVAKRELGRRGPVRWVLSRMGTRFVQRDDVHASVEDARMLLEAAQAGQCLVFFPEGTLSREPGLRAFHMGAFVTAAQAGLAVLPVSLRGTRSVLRDGAWWPRRHPVQVYVHAPLHAAGRGWSEALALRDAARERIGATCGEPLLPA